MSEKVYEIREPMFFGGGATIYSIKNKVRLVAKISNSIVTSPEWASNNQKYIKENLERELFIGKTLYRNGISVPRYIGVVKVCGKLWNKNTKLMTKENIQTIALILEVIDNVILIKEDIEQNNKYYQRGLYLLRKEKKKFKQLPIEIVPQGDFQGLYSVKEDKIYIIDFDLYYLGGKRVSFWKNILRKLI